MKAHRAKLESAIKQLNRPHDLTNQFLRIFIHHYLQKWNANTELNRMYPHKEVVMAKFLNGIQSKGNLFLRWHHLIMALKFHKGTIESANTIIGAFNQCFKAQVKPLPIHEKNDKQAMAKKGDTLLRFMKSWKGPVTEQKQAQKSSRFC